MAIYAQVHRLLGKVELGNIMKKRIRPSCLTIILIQLVVLLQAGCPDNKTKCAENTNQVYFADQNIEVKLTTLSGGVVSCNNKQDPTLCAQIGNRYRLSLETMVDMKIFAFRLERDSLSSTCSLAFSKITYIGKSDSKKEISTILSSDSGGPVDLLITNHNNQTHEEIYLIGLHPKFYQDLVEKIEKIEKANGDELMLLRILQHNICARLPGCDPAKDPPPVKDPSGKGGGQDIRFQRVPILRTE